MTALVIINGDRIARYARHPDTGRLRATHCATIIDPSNLSHGGIEGFRVTPVPEYALPEGERWHK